MQRLLVGLQVGRKSPFVSHRGVVSLLLQHIAQRMEDLGAHTQGVAKAWGPEGHDHELLQVDGVVRVLPAVQDVHHGGGQGLGIHAAEVPVERQPHIVRRRLGHGHGHAQKRVGPELLLLGRPVQLAQEMIQIGLIRGLHALDLGGDGLIDVLHGLGDALPQVPARVAIAKLQRLARARGRPGRHRRPAQGAALQ